MAKETTYQNIVVKNLPNSEIEIEGDIVAETVKQSFTEAVSDAVSNTELPGFRKGHVPEKVLRERFGDMHFLEKAAEKALKKAYPKILAEKKIDAIGQPEIAITKIALDNPLSFRIKTAVFPHFSLPDYKKIARAGFSKKEEVKVLEKDVEDTILTMRKISAGKKPDEEGGDLPPLTDELAKTLGNFENIEDLKKKVSETLLREKTVKAKEKSRLAVMNQIIEEADIPLPQVLIDGELSRMTAEFKHDIARMGFEYEKYLEQIKKTEEDIRKEWEKDAKRRVKFEILLNKIAEEEKIEAPKNEIDREVEHLLSHHAGAPRERVEAYVSHMLRNEKVFQFLENLT